MCRLFRSNFPAGCLSLQNRNHGMIGVEACHRAIAIEIENGITHAYPLKCSRSPNHPDQGRTHLAEIFIPPGDLFEKAPLARFHRAEKAVRNLAARETKIFDECLHDQATGQRTAGVTAHSVSED